MSLTFASTPRNPCTVPAASGSTKRSSAQQPWTLRVHAATPRSGRSMVHAGWEAGVGVVPCYSEGAFLCRGGSDIRRRSAEALFFVWQLNIVAPAPFAVWPERAGRRRACW
jgi:hypothetical protein